MFLSILLLLIGGSTMHAITHQELLKIKTFTHPFTYDVGIKVIPSTLPEALIMICCHGYGHSNRIGDVVHSFHEVSDHIVSFNFPDFGITGQSDHRKASFGTIHEILPLLYVIKRCVVDLKQDMINLYGFSAGGGAIINALAILNQDRFDQELQKVGISLADKKQMIQAVQAGIVILDCPLKSMDEVVDFLGKGAPFKMLVQNYVKNNMRPIDAIQAMTGLKLSILLHFQNPDEILGNRDDMLFADRLKAANHGKTVVAIGHEGGHNSFHTSLWKMYKSIGSV